MKKIFFCVVYFVFFTILHATNCLDVAGILKEGIRQDDQTEASDEKAEEVQVATKRKELIYKLAEYFFNLLTAEMRTADFSHHGKDKISVENFLLEQKKKFIQRTAKHIREALAIEREFLKCGFSNEKLQKVIDFYKSMAGKELLATQKLLAEAKPTLEGEEYLKELTKNLSLDTEKKFSEFLKTQVGSRFLRHRRIAEIALARVFEKVMDEEEKFLIEEAANFLADE